MLSPWQRMMRQRVGQQQDRRRHPAIPQGYRETAHLLQQISRTYPDPPPLEIEDSLGNAHEYDYTLSPDQMAWQVEDELEKWDDFVGELRERRKPKGR